MKRLATGAGIAIILLIALGCKSTKLRKSQLTEVSSRSEVNAITASVTRQLETDYLGDSLQGRMPLPFTVPRGVTYEVEAGGITLEIVLSDSTISYTAIARPVARSRLSQNDSTSTLTSNAFDVVRMESQEKVKKKTGLPWWVWLALVLVIAGLILRYFNPLKLKL